MKESNLLEYFESETDEFDVKSIALVETKASYLWTVKCYLVETNQDIDFYLFDEDTLPLNLYPIQNGLSISMYSDCVKTHSILAITNQIW